MPNQPKAKNSPQQSNQKPMTPKTEVKTKTKIKASTKIIIGAILAVGVAIGIGAVILFFGGGPAPPLSETARFEVEFGPVNKATWDSLPDDYNAVVDYFKTKFDDFFPSEERDDVIYMGSNQGSGLGDWLEDHHLWGRDKDGAGGIILDTFYFTHAHRVNPDYGNTLLKTVNDETECNKINTFSLAPETLTIDPSAVTYITPYSYLLHKVNPVLKDNSGNDLPQDSYHIRYKSLNPEVAVVYPEGQILPISPGTTQINASVCGRQSTNLVSVEVTREGFSGYNLSGQVSTDFLNGVARSKIIDLGDLSGKFIKKLTLYLNISDAYKQMYDSGFLSSDIYFYASNDGGQTWAKANSFPFENKAPITKDRDIVTYPSSIEFDFTSKRPGNQLRLAMEIRSDTGAGGDDVALEPGTAITGDVDPNSYVGNTFGNIKVLNDTPENINSGVYGLLAVDELNHVDHFGSTRYSVSPPGTPTSDFDPVYTDYYNNRYKQMISNYLFGFHIDGVNRIAYNDAQIEWKINGAQPVLAKEEGASNRNLPLYTQERGYTSTSTSTFRFKAQNKGFTHLAYVDKSSSRKLSEIGVLVVPAPSPIIHSLKGVADLTTDSGEFTMPAVTLETPSLEASLGTIDTLEFMIPPLSFWVTPSGTATSPPPGDSAICESPTIEYRGHNRAIIRCLPGEAYKDKDMKAFYGESPTTLDKEVKVYKDKDGNNYFVLRGLKGGEADTKNDEGYTFGRFPYYFKFESEGISSPVHSFKTLNRPQTIAYYYNLIFTDRIDFLSFEELKDYRGDRKEGIKFYSEPDNVEPLTLQGVKFALLNDPGQEFIKRLKVTAGITGNKAQVERLYQIIHDRIYDDNLEKHFDQAGVDFWVAQMEQIEEKRRIDLLGVMFGMMTSPEFFNTLVEHAGGDKLQAQAELAYQIVLQRGADKAGLEYLKTTFKKNKEMREYLLKVDPKEYNDRIEKIEKDKEMGRKVAIAKFYETIYGRPADVAGVEYWNEYKIKDEKTGKERLATILELKDIFLASDEFKKVVKD